MRRRHDVGVNLRPLLVVGGVVALVGAVGVACGSSSALTANTLTANTLSPTTQSPSVVSAPSSTSGAQVPLTTNVMVLPVTTLAHGSSVDSIKVTKCYTNATAGHGGQMLIKARSSDLSARLFAFRPDGSLIGEVENATSKRYGGTVFAYTPTDPIEVTIKSTSGGSITVRTTPFQAEN